MGIAGQFAQKMPPKRTFYLEFASYKSYRNAAPVLAVVLSLLSVFIISLFFLETPVNLRVVTVISSVHVPHPLLTKKTSMNTHVDLG